ncbi:hypothetical protein KC19_1G081100 [Ceratodon purpureus]|uniref:BAG domain-containing protein n=1 Tax=Ceratodon purpureus TaxID=3225 RepID=A0A8T0J4Y1_CERPU|nr:hypothetical protein KC19_1G081100 [Ceratodon purpureus]
MGGGFFDNMWDPYSGAYANPRARAQPRAPVRVPEVRSPRKVEEPLRKKSTVRTIPVSDGEVAVPQAGVSARRESAVGLASVVGGVRSEGSAATKVQAAYRGYLVRKTQPLKQLRVIKKVREELEGFEERFREPGQQQKLRSDAQERLRWAEGIMALLLRLDSLQGVHPEVRIVRKAVTKELIQFQEMIDSMSAASGGLNGKDEASNGEAVDTSDAEENSDGDGTEVSTSAKHGPQVQSDMHDEVVDSHVTIFPESIGEGVGFVSDPESAEADAEHPVDVEKKEQILTTLPTTGEVEVASASAQTKLPYTDTESDNHEPLAVEDCAATEPSRDVICEPISEEDASTPPPKENNVEEMWDETHNMERGEEADMLTEEAGRPVLQDMSHSDENDVSGNNFDEYAAPLEETETTSGFTDQGDGLMISAGCTRSMSLEPQCIDSLQVSQPSTADDIPSLSDRALLLQLLEENRKLKDVVGKVLHWGKHQNDVIRNLTARIEQLEEDLSQRNLLEDEGRKPIGNGVSLVGDMLENGRRNPGNRPQLGNDIDSDLPNQTNTFEYFYMPTVRM